MAEESHPAGGSVALVTGAGGGIGEAVAEALVEIGCRVVCAGRRTDRIEAVAVRLGSSAHALHLDVTDRKLVDGLFDRLPKELHDIDILVNNAGHDIGGRRRFDQGAMTDWESIIETNVLGLIRVTHKVIAGMIARDRGHINTGIRVTEILPGMVRTDFASHRWCGDEARADNFYREFGVCLAPADVARTVVFAVQQPPHVVIAQLIVVPISQS